MVDMSKSIEPKSDQMNAEDLLAGPRTFTITDVRGGSDEQPIWVYVAEHPQPFKPSKTVRRMMVAAWGLDSAAYIGKRMTLYCDPEIMFGPDKVGGIRVSHMSGLAKALDLALTKTRGRRVKYTILPLPDHAPARPVPVDLAPVAAAFDAARITDPAERLAYCRRVAGRQLGSAWDLTPAEVGKVVQALGSEPGQAAPALPPAPDDLDDIPAPAPAETSVERVERLAREAAPVPVAEPSDDELAEAYEREQAAGRG
jgi:hypothetical protein